MITSFFCSSFFHDFFKSSTCAREVDEMRQGEHMDASNNTTLQEEIIIGGLES